MLVRAAAYRVGFKTPRDVASAYGLDCARAMTSLADHVESFDRSSSASVQHYIETGRYLTHGDTEL